MIHRPHGNQQTPRFLWERLDVFEPNFSKISLTSRSERSSGTPLASTSPCESSWDAIPTWTSSKRSGIWILASSVLRGLKRTFHWVYYWDFPNIFSTILTSAVEKLLLLYQQLQQGKRTHKSPGNDHHLGETFDDLVDIGDGPRHFLLRLQSWKLSH